MAANALAGEKERITGAPTVGTRVDQLAGESTTITVNTTD